MLRPHLANDRFHTKIDWLDSRHSFSFAEHYDPSRLGFGPLRVINEDWIAPGKGFDTHPHRDMEILTYMLAGALEHKDSMGNGSVIRPGEIQRMTAGTGVFHSERNASPTERAHLLQIWIQPEHRDLTPGYEQSSTHLGPGLTLLAAPKGEAARVSIDQNVWLYAASVTPAAPVTHALQQAAWVQVVHGSPTLNGLDLQPGDGVEIDDEPLLTLSANRPAEVLLFDMRPKVASAAAAKPRAFRR